MIHLHAVIPVPAQSAKRVSLIRSAEIAFAFADKDTLVMAHLANVLMSMSAQVNAISLLAVKTLYARICQAAMSVNAHLVLMEIHTPFVMSAQVLSANAKHRIS